VSLPRWTDYNIIKSSRPFEISEFVTAFHYSAKPYFEPYYEKFDFSQIFLVLDGKGRFATRTKSYDISSGMMFYRPAGQESIYEWTSENARFALISFVCQSKYLKAFCNGPITLHEEEINLLFELIETATRICEPIKENEKTQGLRLKQKTSEVVLGYILSSLERFLSIVYCRLNKVFPLVDESRKANEFIGESRYVAEVKKYLQDNVDKKMSIKEICTHFGVGQTTLMKRFRSNCGIGVIEYFTALKIEKAKELISSTAMSFSEIAEMLSFSSSNYFSRVFKDRTGLTPTEYSKHVSKRSSAYKV